MAVDATGVRLLRTQARVACLRHGQRAGGAGVGAEAAAHAAGGVHAHLAARRAFEHVAPAAPHAEPAAHAALPVVLHHVVRQRPVGPAAQLLAPSREVAAVTAAVADGGAVQGVHEPRTVELAHGLLGLLHAEPARPPAMRIRVDAVAVRDAGLARLAAVSGKAPAVAVAEVGGPAVSVDPVQGLLQGVDLVLGGSDPLLAGVKARVEVLPVDVVELLRGKAGAVLLVLPHRPHVQERGVARKLPGRLRLVHQVEKTDLVLLAEKFGGISGVLPQAGEDAARLPHPKAVGRRKRKAHLQGREEPRHVLPHVLRHAVQLRKAVPVPLAYRPQIGHGVPLLVSTPPGPARAFRHAGRARPAPHPPNLARAHCGEQRASRCPSPPGPAPARCSTPAAARRSPG